MKCLKMKYPHAVLEDVTIGDDTLCLLTDDHLKYLKVTGFLESTMQKKEETAWKVLGKTWSHRPNG